MKNIEIVKLIADTFYITFLPKSEKYKPKEELEVEAEIKLLEKYTYSQDKGDLFFNEKEFITDIRNKRNKKPNSKGRSFFKKLLPEELLTMKPIELEKTLRIVNTYYNNIRQKDLEGGYIRAVLEVLYDSKFRNEFNKLRIVDLIQTKPVITNYLEKIWPYGESFFVLEYLKDSCYETEYNGNKILQWNYSFTDRKKIKKKKINQYTAYKLYAQEAYSKLRIGLKKQGISNLESKETYLSKLDLLSKEFKDNPEKQDAYCKLKTLQEIGFYEIFDKINHSSYQKIKNFSQEFREGDKAQEAWEQTSDELNYLTDRLIHILQGFNGSYIAYSLDNVLISFYGYNEEETAEIEKEFSHSSPKDFMLRNKKSSFTIIDKIDYIKEYLENNPNVKLLMKKNDWEEIVKKTEFNINYFELAKSIQLPDSYIYSHYELEIISKAYAEIKQFQEDNTIGERIDEIDKYLSTNPGYIVRGYKKPLKDLEGWNNIKQKKILAMSISLDEPVGESGEKTVADFKKDDENPPPDKEVIDKMTLPSKYCETLKGLFKKYFDKDTEKEFLNRVNILLDNIDEELSNEERNTKSVWLEEILRDKNNEKHHYYRWRSLYNEVFESKIKKEQLDEVEKKMKKIYWDFKKL